MIRTPNTDPSNTDGCTYITFLTNAKTRTPPSADIWHNWSHTHIAELWTISCMASSTQGQDHQKISLKTPVKWRCVQEEVFLIRSWQQSPQLDQQCSHHYKVISSDFNQTWTWKITWLSGFYNVHSSSHLGGVCIQYNITREVFETSMYVWSLFKIVKNFFLSLDSCLRGLSLQGTGFILSTGLLLLCAP